MTTTSIGPICKGDVVFYLWQQRGRPARNEWAVVSSRSSLTPNIVFGRNQDGRARAINIADITRITREKESQ